MFRDMKIGMKLSVMAGFLLLLMVVTGAVGVLSLKSGNDAMRGVYNDRVVPLRQLKAVSDMYAVNVVDTAHKVRNGNISPDEGVKNITDALKNVGEQWKAYTATFLTGEEKKLISEAEPLMKKADESIQKVLGYMKEKNVEKVSAYTVSELYPNIDPISSKVSDLVDLQLAVAKKDYESQEAAYRRELCIVMGVILLGVIAAIFLCRSIIAGITGPLREVVGLSDRLAHGDLTAMIDARGKDEVGELAESMRRMVKGLKGIIAQVKESSESLVSASEQLSASSEQMSAGVLEQSGRAAQIAAASEQMAQTVLDVAKNTVSMASSARETSDTARTGREVVTRSVTDVKEIASTVNNSAGTMRSLGEKSIQIGEIVGVISDISDQTNLLALNAAIEAARAGEQGRGFAVVADEVRKLAERSAHSTSEIETMIKGIQEEVDGAVSAMGQASRNVETGVKYSTEAGETFEVVVKSVDELQAMVQQIASAAEEMSSTSDEVSRDIQAIAHSSNEISTASGEVSRASASLAQLASKLNGAVALFKM